MTTLKVLEPLLSSSITPEKILERISDWLGLIGIKQLGSEDPEGVFAGMCEKCNCRFEARPYSNKWIAIERWQRVGATCEPGPGATASMFDCSCHRVPSQTTFGVGTLVWRTASLDPNSQGFLWGEPLAADPVGADPGCKCRRDSIALWVSNGEARWVCEKCLEIKLPSLPGVDPIWDPEFDILGDFGAIRRTFQKERERIESMASLGWAPGQMDSSNK